jgi:hypothetical protein
MIRPLGAVLAASLLLLAPAAPSVAQETGVAQSLKAVPLSIESRGNR